MPAGEKEDEVLHFLCYLRTEIASKIIVMIVWYFHIFLFRDHFGNTETWKKMRILLSEAELQRFQVTCVLVSGMVCFCCSFIFVDFRLEASLPTFLHLAISKIQSVSQPCSSISDHWWATFWRRCLQLHIRSLVGYLLKEMLPSSISGGQCWMFPIQVTQDTGTQGS